MKCNKPACNVSLLCDGAVSVCKCPDNVTAGSYSGVMVSRSHALFFLLEIEDTLQTQQKSKARTRLHAAFSFPYQISLLVWLLSLHGLKEDGLLMKVSSGTLMYLPVKKPILMDICCCDRTKL